MNTRRILQVARGVATFIPGVRLPVRATGGTNTAEYCYAVWLRHLSKAAEHGLDADPKSVAELGPGDSVGVGLAALLAGAEEYQAFDVVNYVNLERNLAVFEGLLDLFRRRADIPGDEAFPELKPKLADYRFPHHLLTEQRLAAAIVPSRIERIGRSLREPGVAGSLVSYRAPWFDVGVVQPQSVDMVFSQAVMEHVNDPLATYRAIYEWLKPGGFMSHQIDFKCHGTSDYWNGHWTYPDWAWKILIGRGQYSLNRQSHSIHLGQLAQCGFKLLADIPVTTPSTLPRRKLARRFAALSDTDLSTSGAFLLAQKPLAHVAR